MAKAAFILVAQRSWQLFGAERQMRARGFIRLTEAFFESWWQQGKSAPYRKIWEAFPTQNRALLESKHHLYPLDDLFVTTDFKGLSTATWLRVARSHLGEAGFWKTNELRQFLQLDPASSDFELIRMQTALAQE